MLKRFFTLFLIVLIVFCLSVPAFAEEDKSGNISYGRNVATDLPSFDWFKANCWDKVTESNIFVQGDSSRADSFYSDERTSTFGAVFNGTTLDYFRTDLPFYSDGTYFRYYSVAYFQARGVCCNIPWTDGGNDFAQLTLDSYKQQMSGSYNPVLSSSLISSISHSSVDISDSAGTTVVFPKNMTLLDGGQEPQQNEEWTAFGDLRMRIVEPLDNAKFSGTNKISMVVNFEYPIKAYDSDGGSSRLEYTFNGFLEDRYSIVSDKYYSYVVGNVGDVSQTYSRRSVVVEGYIPSDVETVLSVTGRLPAWWLPGALEPSGTVAITVTAFSDFVDANGDGLDDRTNRPNGDSSLSGGSAYPGIDDEEGSTNPTDVGLSGSIDTSSLNSIFNGFSGFQSGFITLMQQFFGWLPAPFWTLILFGMGLIVALRIFGR